jgi:alpha-mannosidase
MKFEELIVLLPCHSLEDFPTYQEGEEAEGLLAAWTALWHPALLASAGSLPAWYRADGPPAELAGRLVVVPSASERLLLAGWNARAAEAGACVVRKCTARADILRAALGQLDGAECYVPRDGLPAAEPTDGEAASLPPPDPSRGMLDLAADFLALGYTYLMVELLTRQMRYMSNLDEVHLRNEALAAARSFVAGQADECRNHLGACFKVLLEARERFYPVEAYLVDLALVAATTLGEDLRGELSQPGPLNLLLTAEHLEEMERTAPESLAALRRGCHEGRVCLVGGEYAEGPLALAPCEGMLAGLRRGLAAYERLLGRRPAVYGRRRHGLNPLLPQILSRLGFAGALHFTLDEGHFPHAGQSKIRWQGLDASAIDALLRVAADASRVETFPRGGAAVGPLAQEVQPVFRGPAAHGSLRPRAGPLHLLGRVLYPHRSARRIDPLPSRSVPGALPAAGHCAPGAGPHLPSCVVARIRLASADR